MILARGTSAASLPRPRQRQRQRQQRCVVVASAAATPPPPPLAPHERVVEFAAPGGGGTRLVGTLLEAAAADTDTAAAAGGGAAASAGAAAAAAAPVALLVHGYMSDRNSELLVRLARALRAAGVASLRFDLAGNGASGGAFRYGRYRDEAAQIAAAAAFVRGVLHRPLAGVVGHSKGATDALLFAALACGSSAAVAPGSSAAPDPSRLLRLRPPCVVSIAARVHVAGGVVERLGEETMAALQAQGEVEMRGRSRSRGAFDWQLRREDVEDRLETDVAGACRDIRGCSVLIAHGDADADVPVAEARLLAELLQDAVRNDNTTELLVVPGGDHSFRDGGAFYALAQSAVPFVAKHAAAAAAAATDT